MYILYNIYVMYIIYIYIYIYIYIIYIIFQAREITAKYEKQGKHWLYCTR